MKPWLVKACLPFITFFILVTALLSCQEAACGKLFERREDGSVRLFDGRVVPLLPPLLGVRAQYELRLETDSVLRPGAYRSIEFSARTAVPAWSGETVLIPMEDDAYLTENGYVYFRPHQTKWSDPVESWGCPPTSR